MTPTGPTYPFNVYRRPGGQFLHGVTYIYDPDLIVYDAVNVAATTGGLRPLYSTDLVFTADSVQISGINVNTDQLETINTSGTQYLASISGQLIGNLSVSNDGVTGTFGTVLGANPARKAWYLQNLQTGALMVRLGTSFPSTANLNMMLQGGTVINDGKGGVYEDEQGRYRGAVSVSGFGGATVSCAVWAI